jgi:hypothetical protein
MNTMKLTNAVVLVIVCGTVIQAADPQFTASGELVRPQNYREWVFLSAGLGMTYSGAPRAAGSDPAFDNVFVEPSAYRKFVETGKWPDKTIFVLEQRRAMNSGCLNNDGCRYQGEIAGVAAEVKDVARFKGEWAYFGFGPDVNTARALTEKANCYTCHPANGAVENTFVQFYPTLIEIARAKGTLKPSYLKSASANAH